MDGVPSYEPQLTELVVHAYDWVVREEYGDDDGDVIHCWSLDRDSNPHLLRFPNFPAFCHVELPMFVRNRLYTWRRPAIEQFIRELNGRLRDHAPIRYVFKEAKKCYYYRGNRKFPMLQLSFHNTAAMRHCVNILKNAIKTDDWGYIKCNVWEDSISMVRKLLTVRDIKYAQWFRVTGMLVEPDLRVSTLEREYVVQWDTMEAVPEEECQGWLTRPGILAFDIECYSNNKRQFPDKYNAKHCAWMISGIYQRYKERETRRRYGIIMGDCHHIPEDVLDHCEIIRVETEYELVEAFARVTNETDPEILTGYNIFGFDYPYLDHRIRRGLRRWPHIGRMRGETTEMTSKNWSSGAYGHQSINMLKMEGRISIDMLPVVKRDYKLPMYNLDTVCKEFLGTTKHDVTAPQMFEIYESMIEAQSAYRENPSPENEARFERAKEEATRVMAYCIQDSELIIDLMEKLDTWVMLVELSSVVGTNIQDLYTRGQQVRCYSQIYDLAARMGYILDSRDAPVFGFTGGSVWEPQPGLYDNVLCWDFASLYPSIIMRYNICYTTLIPPELENEVPDEDCNIIEFDQEEELNPVDVDEDEEDEEFLQDIVGGARKSQKVTRHYRFKYYKGHEGLLPRLVRQLVTERRRVRDVLMKQTNDPVMKGILDARQLALKVAGNSMFGFLGVRNGGMMPLMEAAMSTTAWGRQLLNIANNYIIDTYGHRGAKIIYNDTDSTMATIGIADSKDCQYWGERISHEYNGVKKGDPLPCAKDPEKDVYTEDREGVFQYPIVFEFEKAMRMLCIRKKKYVALYIDKNGNFKMIPLRDENGKILGPSEMYDMLLRGIVLARRDNCQFLRQTYTDILNIIMRRRGIEDAMDILCDAIQRLLAGQVPYDDLIIVRGLGGNYKNDSYFMKVFADELHKAGKPVNPGDRLDFLIVEQADATLLGKKMRLREQYLESLETDSPEQIDYMYYIEKALMNPINQLFEVGFQSTIPQLSNIFYRPTNRHKPIYLDQPVKMIVRMIERGVDISTLKHAVRFNIQKLRGEFKPQLNILQPPTPQLRIVAEEKKQEENTTVTTLNIITAQPAITKAVTPAITKVVMPKIASRSPPRMQLRILPAAN